MNSEKCASLRMICSDKGPRPNLPRKPFTSVVTAWLRADETSPVCMELRKIKRIQASSAAVKITRNAMSQGDVFCCCIVLLLCEDSSFETLL